MHIVQLHRERENYLSLLLLADPYEPMIRRYLQDAEVYLLKEGDTPLTIAAITGYPSDCRACELKNLATAPNYQRQGHASYLLNYLFSRYGAIYSTMYVGTTQTALPFYYRLGFQDSHILPRFFIDNYPDPIYEEGVQCVDMLYLKKELSPY